MTDIITVDDIRKLYCAAGMRRWFEAHNLNFMRFVKEGISADELLATGDALAVKVVESVRHG